MTAVDKFDEMTYIDPYADVPHPGDDGSVIGQPSAGIRSRLLKMSDLRNLPQPAPLITSLMDLDTLALLYGRRGSYKSFLALDWALCVAYGRRWHSQAVTAGPVLYVCAEGAHGVDQRIDAWKRHNGVIGDTDELDTLPESINLLSPSSAGELADVARDIGARLVILDTWARCTVGGEENSTKDMGLAIEQADVIRRRSGACVLAVHHSGKDSTAGARGSSALEAAFDSVFEIGAVDDVVTLKTTKQKHHAEGNPWYLRAISERDSIVLALNSLTASDELSPGVLATLAALAGIETSNGIATSVWRDQTTSESKSSPATFYRHLKTMVSLTLVSNVGTDKQPRYLVSDAGTLTLSQHSQAKS